MIHSPNTITSDEKEQAGLSLAHVIKESETFFPDPRYRPVLLNDSTLNRQTGFNAHHHFIRNNNDGIGTKPELAERLFEQTGDYRYFESLAFDGIAMVADDAARNGQFVLGVSNNLDVNSAEDSAFVTALSRGALAACKTGRFPLLDGETAELGYRSPGIGSRRVNWNFTAMSLTNRDKLIDGSNLKSGQRIVVLREKSIRSNGLTRARAILENAYLQQENLTGEKMDVIAEMTKKKLEDIDVQLETNVIDQILQNVSQRMGMNISEYMQLPWHERFQQETEMLLQPSTIYTPLMYEAQGGVDGDVQVPIIAAAHISGGGIPLKGKRMVEQRRLGLALEHVFPDPEAVTRLMELSEEYPQNGKVLVDNRSACEQWNRGVGFMCVVEDSTIATDLVQLASNMGYEAADGGIVTEKPVIEWRGETWEY